MPVGGRRTRRRPQHHHWLNGPVNGSRKHKMLGRYIITSGKSVKNVFAGKGSRPFVPSPTNTPSTDIEARQSLIAVLFRHSDFTESQRQKRHERGIFVLHCPIPHPCGSPSWSVFSVKTLTITDNRPTAPGNGTYRPRQGRGLGQPNN